jgi:hypothetical protein
VIEHLKKNWIIPKGLCICKVLFLLNIPGRSWFVPFNKMSSKCHQNANK